MTKIAQPRPLGADECRAPLDDAEVARRGEELAQRMGRLGRLYLEVAEEHAGRKRDLDELAQEIAELVHDVETKTERRSRQGDLLAGHKTDGVGYANGVRPKASRPKARRSSAKQGDGRGA